MLPHLIPLLTTILPVVIHLTHASTFSDFISDNTPIQSNLEPSAKSNPSPIYSLEPTRRLFTVAAYVRPWACNPQPGRISGAVMRAEGGTFWLDLQNPLKEPVTDCGDSAKKEKCPPGNETVLFVDRHGNAWLDSENPQQIYLDTSTGVLSYLSPATNPEYTFQRGAVGTGFLHFGASTVVCKPSPQPGYWMSGPGAFLFSGYQYNPSWFACPTPGTTGYRVMRSVGGYEDWSRCMAGLDMVALDYSGPSPVAGRYL